jgi:hypothetical protein
MGWIVINPVNQTYDGVYTHRNYADEACTHWREAWGEPICYVRKFDGNARKELEPHYKFMADAKYKECK